MAGPFRWNCLSSQCASHCSFAWAYRIRSTRRVSALFVWVRAGLWGEVHYWRCRVRERCRLSWGPVDLWQHSLCNKAVKTSFNINTFRLRSEQSSSLWHISCALITRYFWNLNRISLNFKKQTTFHRIRVQIQPWKQKFDKKNLNSRSTY